MTQTDWSTMRKKWVKTRDAAKVPSGAVKSVSIGDSLDGVAKAMKLDYRHLAAATSKLLADLDTYSAAIKTKSPRLVGSIDTDFRAPARALKSAVDNDVAVYRALAKLLGSEDKRARFNPPPRTMELVKLADASGKPFSSMGSADHKTFLAWLEFWPVFTGKIATLVARLVLDPPKQRSNAELRKISKTMSLYGQHMVGLRAAADKPDFATAMKHTWDEAEALVGYFDELERLVTGFT